MNIANAQKDSVENMDEFLRIAKEAAMDAGNVLSKLYANDAEIKSDEGKDIKLVADVSAEHRIIQHLRTRTKFPILSEEAGCDVGAKQQGYWWVVDPLDGTLNYSRKIPLCCVSVALWDGDEPILGVVHNFFSGETYSAIVGKGAFVQIQNASTDMQIGVSGIDSDSKAVLMTGFPSGSSFETDSLMDVARNAARYKKVRSIGSAALSLTWVASGRADVYEEKDIYIWDVAAGLALVVAAAGEYEMVPGNGIWKYNVRASNGRLKR